MPVWALYYQKLIQLLEVEKNEQTFESIIGDRDDDDLRQTAPGSFPPEYYVAFLNEPQTIKQIGARGTYSECPDAPFNKFEKTGDVSLASLVNMNDFMVSRMQGHGFRNYQRS